MDDGAHSAIHYTAQEKTVVNKNIGDVSKARLKLIDDALELGTVVDVEFERSKGKRLLGSTKMRKLEYHGSKEESQLVFKYPGKKAEHYIKLGKLITISKGLPADEHNTIYSKFDLLRHMAYAKKLAEQYL